MSTTSDGMTLGSQGVGSDQPGDAFEAEIQRALALSLETERMDELRRKRLGIPSLPQKASNSKRDNTVPAKNEKTPVALTKSCSAADSNRIRAAATPQANTGLSNPPRKVSSGGDSGKQPLSATNSLPPAEVDLMSFGFDHVMKNYSGSTTTTAPATTPSGAAPLPSPLQPLASSQSFGMGATGQGLSRPSAMQSQSLRQPQSTMMTSSSVEPSKNPFNPFAPVNSQPMNSQPSALARFHQTRNSFAAPMNNGEKLNRGLGLGVQSQKHISRSSPSSPESRHRMSTTSATTTPTESNSSSDKDAFSDLLSTLGMDIGASKTTEPKKEPAKTKSEDSDVSLINLAPSFKQITSIHHSNSASSLSAMPPPLPPKAKKSHQGQLHVSSSQDSTSMRRIHSNPSFGTMEASATPRPNDLSGLGLGLVPPSVSQNVPQQTDRSSPLSTIPKDSTDPSDLILFGSRSLADKADFFDFSYFDPLQPPTPDPVPEPTSTQTDNQQGNTTTVDSNRVQAEAQPAEEAKAVPKLRSPREVEEANKQRPTSIEVEESEQGGKRPRSICGAKGVQVEVAEPEPWMPKSAVTVASAKQSKV